MKSKLDENLPIQLVPLLTDLGHDVETVPDEQIAGKDDHVVWTAAQADGRLLVTQDLDFSDARKYAPGTHHGLCRMDIRPGWSAEPEPRFFSSLNAWMPGFALWHRYHQDDPLSFG